MSCSTTHRPFIVTLSIAAGIVLCTAVGWAKNATPPAESTSPAGLARRLCDAVQSLPDVRKAACCGGTANPGLVALCVRDLDRALHEQSLALDPADVDRCAVASAKAFDGCDWVTPYEPRTPSPCRAVLHGRLDLGARCRSSLECRDGLACRGGGPTVAGVCAPPGAPGASCAGSPDALATYTRQVDVDTHHPECAGFCLKGRCTAFFAAGASCSDDRQCASGTHCVARRCAAGGKPALGESCRDTTCDGDLACIDGRCAAPKANGEACAQPSDCAATCLASGVAGQTGTCGTKCSLWPPAGYTPPIASAPHDRAHAD